MLGRVSQANVGCRREASRPGGLEGVCEERGSGSSWFAYELPLPSLRTGWPREGQSLSGSVRPEHQEHKDKKYS